tara:strand:- start:54 stop:503 length:450 start_codon:yes stop_codon:yes gene_type:complete
MAKGADMGSLFDPIKKKLNPIRDRVRGFAGAGQTLTDPKAIARARRNPLLSITDTEVEVPTETRYPDAILRGKLGSKAPIVSSQTISGVATEMDQEFLSMLPGAFMGDQKGPDLPPGKYGRSEGHEVTFEMPKRKKKNLYDMRSYGGIR